MSALHQGGTAERKAMIDRSHGLSLTLTFLLFSGQFLLDFGTRVVGIFQLCGEFVRGQVVEA